MEKINEELAAYLREKAKECGRRDAGNANLVRTYRRAASAVQSAPYPITSGREAMLLKGIGPKIGKMLDTLIAEKQSGVVLSCSACSAAAGSSKRRRPESVHEAASHKRQCSLSTSPMLPNLSSSILDTPPPLSRLRPPTQPAPVAATTTTTLTPQTQRAIDSILSKYTWLDSPVANSPQLSHSAAHRPRDVTYAASPLCAPRTLPQHAQVPQSSSSARRDVIVVAGRDEAQKKEYSPRPRSGGWALLMALYRNGTKAMKKESLMRAAAAYSESSFFEASNGYHTAWNSMTTLTKHNLVNRFRERGIVKFKLTDKGWDLANRLGGETFVIGATVPSFCVVSPVFSPSTGHLSHADGLRNPDPFVSNVAAGQHASHGDVAVASSVSLLCPQKELDPTPPRNRPPPLHAVEVIDLETDSDEPQHLEIEPSPSMERADTIPMNAEIAAMAESSVGGLIDSLDLPLRLRKERMLPVLSPPSNMPEGPPTDVQITLCLDTRELYGNRRSGNKGLLRSHLNELGCKIEERSLPMGDMIWIVRCSWDGEAIDFVMNYVLERKTLEDLCSSIIDRRYQEQKWRLKNSPIKNLFYIVEGDPWTYRSNSSIPASPHKILTALNETMLEGLQIVTTPSLEGTAKYLNSMTDYIVHSHNFSKIRWAEEIKKYMTFEQFKKYLKSGAKNVQEIFARQLFHIPGCGLRKAKAIYDRFRTPKRFIASMEGKTQNEVEAIITSMKYGDQDRRLGPQLGRTVYHTMISENEASFEKD